jgi:hypothetical protein
MRKSRLKTEWFGSRRWRMHQWFNNRKDIRVYHAMMRGYHEHMKRVCAIIHTSGWEDEILEQLELLMDVYRDHELCQQDAPAKARAVDALLHEMFNDPTGMTDQKVNDLVVKYLVPFHVPEEEHDEPPEKRRCIDPDMNLDAFANAR